MGFPSGLWSIIVPVPILAFVWLTPGIAHLCEHLCCYWLSANHAQLWALPTPEESQLSRRCNGSILARQARYLSLESQLSCGRLSFFWSGPIIIIATFSPMGIPSGLWSITAPVPILVFISYVINLGTCVYVCYPCPGLEVRCTHMHMMGTCISLIDYMCQLASSMR